MSRHLYIAGVGRISDLEKGSLRIEQALTYQIDTCSFSIKGEQPAEGEEVIVEDDKLGRLFAGIIVKVELARTFPDKTIKVWNVDCDDYTALLDRRLVVESYENMSASDIFLDIVAKYCPGFTTNGVRSGAPVVESTGAEFEYKRPSDCFKWLCDYIGWHWQPDYYKDLHFFSAEELASPAPMILTPGGKFRFGKHSIDTQGLRNRVYVRGGTMLSDPQVVEWKADGVARIWTLPWGPHEVSFKVGEVPMTVGVENLHDEADFDYMMNFTEKYIRCSAHTPTPVEGITMALTARQDIPVITMVEDYASQAAIAKVQGGDGIYEHVISDDTLISIAAAEAAGMADLREHANPRVKGSFETEYTKPESVPTALNFAESGEDFEEGELDGVVVGEDGLELEEEEDTFAKLDDPSSLPTGIGYGCTFDPTGTYLAMAHSSSPYITIYKRNDDTFTKLSDPSTLPSGTGYGVTFDPTGTYLAVAYLSSPYITIYKRNGDTFTKLSDPSTLPSGTGRGVTFDPTGTYLAMAHSSSPYITIYKRNDDTFTKLSDPSTLPSGTGWGVAFDPTGMYLAVAHSSSPYITIYKRNGDTFTKLSDPSTLPSGTGRGVTFDPTGTYLAVAHSSSPYITIYKRNDDTFTKLSDPSTLPSGTGYGVAFDPTGTYLAVAHNTSPYITIYKRDGDTFTKLANPATLPTGIGYGCTFDPTGTYLAVAHNTSPYITIYKRGFTESGSRTSPPIDLSSVCTAKTSEISWQATTPTDTNVKIETSLSSDSGETWGAWQQATNGGSIPGIVADMDLSNAKLKTRVTLETEDTSVTPALNNLTINLTGEKLEPRIWQPGQIVEINLPDRGIQGEYLIQRVTTSPLTLKFWTFRIEYGGRLFGIADFLQALVSAQQKKRIIEPTRNVQKYIYSEDTLELSDELITTPRTLPFICGDSDAICGLVVVSNG